jgi:hypothetical protein
MSDERLRKLERAALADKTDQAAQIEYAAEARRIGFEHALARWLAGLHEATREYYIARFVSLVAPTFATERGTRYVRVVTVDPNGGRSAYCFVDTTTGDLLKPAGWKGPAKGARGSIFAADSLAGCGPYGVAYLNSRGGHFTFVGRDNRPSPLPREA